MTVPFFEKLGDNRSQLDDESYAKDIQMCMFKLNQIIYETEGVNLGHYHYDRVIAFQGMGDNMAFSRAKLITAWNNVIPVHIAWVEKMMRDHAHVNLYDPRAINPANDDN